MGRDPSRLEGGERRTAVDHNVVGGFRVGSGNGDSPGLLSSTLLFQNKGLTFPKRAGSRRFFFSAYLAVVVRNIMVDGEE